MRPSVRVDALASLVPLFLIVTACGGSVAKSDPPPPQQGVDAGKNPPPSQDDPGPPPRVPSDHRPSAVSCSSDRGPGVSPADAAHFDGPCHKDADCTEGKNGRCVVEAGFRLACSYDACTTDADCGSGVCNCRAQPSDANRCFNGSCTTDADCGDSYCSPSGTKVQSNCLFGPDGAIPASSFGYFCHTRSDECVNDADCGSASDEACLFRTDTKRWSCRKLWCTGSAGPISAG